MKVKQLTPEKLDEIADMYPYLNLRNGSPVWDHSFRSLSTKKLKLVDGFSQQKYCHIQINGTNHSFGEGTEIIFT